LPSSANTTIDFTLEDNSERLLSAIPTGRMLDVGANRGDFSRMAEAAGHRVVAIDADWAPIEQLYRSVRASDSTITTLVVDLVSPTPAAGWGLRERPSFLERGRADTILALALVHHLAIGRNVPLGMVAELFAALAARAVVEFVPREDPMVVGLLRDREDVFDDYTRAGFEAAFEAHFSTVARHEISGSARALYLFERR
jgi:ribosomal protein L11 methylase PrmA